MNVIKTYLSSIIKNEFFYGHSVLFIESDILRYVNTNSIIDDLQDLKNVELPFHK